MVKKSVALTLLLLLVYGILLGACSNSVTESTPAGSSTNPLPAPTQVNTGQVLEQHSPATLPPPLIVTIPADMLDITIDVDAAAAGAITAQGDASVGMIQLEDGLPDKVEELLERIYRGDYPIDTTGQTPGSLPATFTYSDMNGDGIEDLVIILVVGPGDYSNITAGSTQGIPVIQIIPKPEPGSVVEGFNIPVDELLAMSNNGESGELGEGAYLITLGPDDLSRWSEPISPE